MTAPDDPLAAEIRDEATAMRLVYGAGKDPFNAALAEPVGQALFDAGVLVGTAAALRVLGRRFRFEAREDE